ncbi:hypothetical protein D6D01_04988 [Aureobasidium pullulans]|uniref:Uncharacterized protein n=1 Tax=Aureobasidium pullulans TaxID=5580 RepID=A0A4S9L8V2_AURPU|nr:hypothetical protein D6D01_04988 [Aureobasidium pullulans]
MADPFTIVVFVGGLANLGIQLLQGLNKYAGSALDSKGRIKAISTDIGLTIQVAQALDTTIQDDANREMMNDDAEKLAQDAIVRRQEIFTKIQSTLPDIDSAGIRKRDFVTWPFIEPKLELLRGNSEKVKATLQLLMNIQKLVEEKANAEARLDKLEREHANALAANVLTPPSPSLSSAGMQMPAVPQDSGPIINLAMVAPHPALDTPTRDLIPTTPEINKTPARARKHSSTQQSPSPSAVHPQEMHASLGASRSITSSDNDPDSESEDIMIALHDDYTACLRKLKTLQLKLDMELKKMFIPTTVVEAPKNCSQDKSSETLVTVFANRDSSDDPIVEVSEDDGCGRWRHAKSKRKQQSSPFAEWMLGGIRPRARPRKHKHLSRSRGVRKTNKKLEMADGVADDVPGSDDSQSQSSGWLTEDDEDSSGYRSLDDISVKRSSGRTSPTDMIPQFNSSPPTLPQRRSSDSGLYVEHDSSAVIDDPGFIPLLADEETVDKESSMSEVSEDGRGGDQDPSFDLEEYKVHLDMLAFLNQQELAQARMEQAEKEVRQVPDSPNAKKAEVETGDSLEVINTDASKRFESVDNIIPPSTSDISGSLLRNWFLPKNGINSQIISADIQRYLGNDASVRPGKDKINGQECYWIKAYRSLTTETINDLQKASTIWEEEERTGRRGTLVLKPPSNILPGAYEDSHAYKQATNAVSDGNGKYRASTNPPQLDSVYLTPRGCVPPHVAQRVPVSNMASTPYEDPRSRMYSLPPYSGALSFLTLGSQPYINIMPAIAYGPPTLIPDQSYTRPASSVDSSYGGERQSASPNVDRIAPHRKVGATFAKRSGRDESHPRTIIDPEHDNDTATNTSGLVTVEDLIRRWTHLDPDSVDSAANLGN